jgi:hypothetical protein
VRDTSQLFARPPLPGTGRPVHARHLHVEQDAVEPLARPLAPPTDAALDTPEGTLGYALGLRIGSRISADFRAQKAPFDFAALAQGLSDAVNGVPADTIYKTLCDQTVSLVFTAHPTQALRQSLLAAYARAAEG